MEKSKLLKKFKSVVFALTLSLVLLSTSCKFATPTTTAEIDRENTKADKVALDYFSRFERYDALYSTRNAKASTVPEYINEIEVEIEDGKTILVSELSEEEKIAFYQIWKEQSIQEITEKLEEDEDLLKMISMENYAFEVTEASAERALIKWNEEDFVKKYMKNLEKVMKKEDQKLKFTRSSSSAASTPSGEVTSDCLVKESVTKLKSIYKKGYILVTTDSTSSASSSSGLGHCSMLAYDEWDDTWEFNGLERMTISSYPKEKNAQWPEKEDGVQYEPIGLWAGNSDSSVNTVKVYKVQSVKWKWNWFNSGYVKTAASNSDYTVAVKYACEQLGKPYSSFFYKNSEKEFYCSSLIYKSWKNIGNEYDMSRFPYFVTPSDIAACNKTIRVISYNNK